MSIIKFIFSIEEELSRGLEPKMDPIHFHMYANDTGMKWSELSFRDPFRRQGYNYGFHTNFL